MGNLPERRGSNERKARNLCLRLPEGTVWKIYALAFAGLAISDQLKTFVSQGLKILIVGIFVMTGTFLGSCLWDQMLLNLAGVI